MKKIYIIVAIIVFTALSLIVAIDIHIDKTAEKRPTVKVLRAEMMPSTFSAIYPEILKMRDSKIYWDYKNGVSDKWNTHYVYAYVITKDNKYFSRETYKNGHPNDATDKNVIFSSASPDPTLFIITWK